NAFNRRDRAAWLALCDPEYETVPSDDWAEMEPIRGPEDAWDFYIEADEPWERSPYEYVEALYGGNDKVRAGVRRAMGGTAIRAAVVDLHLAELPDRAHSPRDRTRHDCVRGGLNGTRGVGTGHGHREGGVLRGGGSRWGVVLVGDPQPHVCGKLAPVGRERR